MSTSPYAGIGQSVSSIPYIGSFLGGIINSIGSAADRDAYQGTINEYSQIQGPQFSDQQYVFQGYDPYLYGDPEAAQYQQIELQPGTREAQLAALMKIQDLGDGYGAAQNEAAQRQAIMNANQAQKSSRDAAIMNANARGVGGSGLEFALGQQGSQNASNQALLGGLQGAQNMALQRLQSAHDYSQGLGSLRNQDTDLSSRNADIINRFNMYNTNARNAVNQRNVDVRNHAGLSNSQGLNNQRMYNFGRNDQNANSVSNFALNKQNAKSNLLNQMLGGQGGDYQSAGQQGGQGRAEAYKLIGSRGGNGSSIDSGTTTFGEDDLGDLSSWGYA